MSETKAAELRTYTYEELAGHDVYELAHSGWTGEVYWSEDSLYLTDDDDGLPMLLPLFYEEMCIRDRSGTWSVSAAWNRAVATVTALPEYRVALSLFEDGSSADFARDLLAAELDSAAVGESLFFLPVRDLLETAAAFEGVGVEGVTLVEGGFMVWISGGEEAVRQTAERLRQMAAYGEVRLEDDPEDPGITRLYCLTAGAEEEE